MEAGADHRQLRRREGWLEQSQLHTCEHHGAAPRSSDAAHVLGGRAGVEGQIDTGTERADGKTRRNDHYNLGMKFASLCRRVVVIAAVAACVVVKLRVSPYGL